jgi:hypothetical protein
VRRQPEHEREHCEEREQNESQHAGDPRMHWPRAPLSFRDCMAGRKKNSAAPHRGAGGAAECDPGSGREGEPTRTKPGIQANSPDNNERVVSVGFRGACSGPHPIRCRGLATSVLGTASRNLRSWQGFDRREHPAIARSNPLPTVPRTAEPDRSFFRPAFTSERRR